MNAATLYKSNEILTADNLQIVVKLYEGAVRFLKLAIKAIDEKDYQTKAKYINKTIDIIFELNSTLDMEKGGEISSNLRSLYIFLYEQIMKANADLNTERLEKAILILSEVNSGWKKIA